MTDYLHHVPGRLRVRSKAFRCDSPARDAMMCKLRDLNGVCAVRLNPKAASIAVSYDTRATEPAHILEVLNRECRHFALKQSTVAKTAQRSAWISPNLTAQIGKIALSVLVNKGVSYSLTSLLGARV